MSQRKGKQDEEEDRVENPMPFPYKEAAFFVWIKEAALEVREDENPFSHLSGLWRWS